MKKVSSNVWLILFLAVTFIMTTACGNNEADSITESDGAEQEGKDQLVVVTWGGDGTKAQREAWYDPFTEETGIEILEVTPPSTSQVKAQVDSGNVEWDVVLMDKTMVDQLIIEGDYLEEIPYDEMDQDLLKGTLEEAKREEGLGAYLWGWVLTYSTDAFDEAPQGWEDFWDVERFPGPRTMMNVPNSSLEVASLAMGKDEDDLYPIDVEAAFDKMDEIRPHISAFWDEGAEGTRMIVDNEAVMGLVYGSQAASVIQDGAPVDIQWNQGLLAMDYWTVPKGRMSNEVIQFLEFVSQAEQQAALANILPYGPTHEDAIDYVDEELKDGLITAHIEKMIPYDYADWWGERRSELTPRWEEWKLE